LLVRQVLWIVSRRSGITSARSFTAQSSLHGLLVISIAAPGVFPKRGED
jgi:hypothetical protein